MYEREYARQLLLLLHESYAPESRAATLVLEWMRHHRVHFWPSPAPTAKKARTGKRRLTQAIAWRSLPSLAASNQGDDFVHLDLASASAVADLLQLEAFERNMLLWAVALQRLPRLVGLQQKLVWADEDVLLLLASLCGGSLSSIARMRRSSPIALGLIEFETTRSGTPNFRLNWMFERLLDRGLCDPGDLLEALVGPRQEASLSLGHFRGHEPEIDFLLRLLRRAAAETIPGINILIHGPPGTGKTELSRALAAAAGAELYAAGEADEDDEEPNRYQRLHALRRAQHILGRRTGSVLLFDEMEDLLGRPASPSSGQPGSKVFVNRLLEANAVPTIWTSNAIDEVDPAHLRRFSFVLNLRHPPARIRRHMVARIAAEEGIASLPSDVEALAQNHAESVSVARTAFRAVAHARSTPEEAAVLMTALMEGMRKGQPLPQTCDGRGLDLDLYEASPDLRGLMPKLTSFGKDADFSLLLTGPPGTGKTALAAYVANRLDRPLLVRRTSDLLSKWVGETEARIAEAFRLARQDGAVLLFDEVDSLLADRSAARHSWEVTQVNELLTWLDQHNLPVIAATNHATRLDPAALRRFLFKVELHELSGAASARAFHTFFGCESPASLARVSGLTPGDFSVVARQLRYRGSASAEEIVDLLAAEARTKQRGSGRIGF